MVALFLTIALGYLVGEINIKGFSLGVGAVLFVGLAIGWFAPQSAPAPTIGTLGLGLFLYAIGIQYGREFFRGLTTAEGRKANLLALLGVLSAGVVSLLLIGGPVKLGYALGLFAGSGTSTPTLQAAIERLGSNDPAVGYSVAYPFGVAGPILLLQLAFVVLKPTVAPPTAGDQELLEIVVRNPSVIGQRLGELANSLPADVQIVAVRDKQRNRAAVPEIVLEADNVVLAISPSKAALDQARQLLGAATSGQVTADRRDVDYLRVFVSRPALVGRGLGELTPPAGIQFLVMHVKRGDNDLLGRPDLVLEFGDRIGLLTNRTSFPAVREFFGDSIKGTSEFSYISIGVGMALGFLVAAIHLPVPGIGRVSIGLAGVLMVALVLGHLRRTGRMNWTIPLSANLVLRNLGLTLFLAQIGMSSGPVFASTVSQTGLLFLAYGAVILFALVLPILLFGLLILRMPFDHVGGIVAGACGNAAILAHVNRLTPTDRPDIAFAIIFPGMTIVKILFVDIVPAFFSA